MKTTMSIMDLAWEHRRTRFADAETIFRIEFMSAPWGKEKAVLMVEYFTDAKEFKRRVNYVLTKESEGEGYKLIGVSEYQKQIPKPAAQGAVARTEL